MENIEESCEGWVNVFRNLHGKIQFGNKVYRTPGEAEEAGHRSPDHYICTTIIEWKDHE